MVTDTVLASRDFAGLHFTGSTHVFKDIWAKWKLTSTTIKHTRIVGETGGKDFIIAHQALTQNKLLLELYVVHLNFKVKNVQQLLDLMFHKVYGSCKEQIITDVKSMKMGSQKILVICYCSNSRRFI
jgi:1-pyrroline-5-carboxylate dehydrogenase